MGTLSRIMSEPYHTLKSVFRYKGVLFWAVVFPLLLYGIMVAVFGNPGYTTLTAGVIVEDKGVDLGNGTTLNLGGILVKAMNESGLFKVKIYNDTSTLSDAVRYGKVDVGLVVPDGFSSNITMMQPAQVRVVVLETQWGDYYESVTEGFLKGFGDSIRDRAIDMGLNYSLQFIPENYTSQVVAFYTFLKKPLEIQIDKHTPPLLATTGGIRAYYALGVIGIEILFIGLSFGVNSIIEMKRDGTLRVLLASPMKNWEIVATLTLSALLAVAISSLSIYLFSLPLGAEYTMNSSTALTTIFLLLVGTLFTIGLGLLLAPLARSPEAAMAIVNSIAFPIMFIGGLTVPTFVLPDVFKKFAEIYPLSLTIEAIRGMTTYSRTPIWAIEKSMPAIIATILVYIIGTLVMTRLLAKAAEE